MLLFKNSGKENTEATLGIALKKAKKLDCPIVLASNEGTTTYAFLQLIKTQSWRPSIISVTHVAGFRGRGIVEMPSETRQDLERQGVTILTATHSLSAGEKSFSKSSGGAYPLEIVANTLRLFGQGTKVSVEICIMAMDAGLLPYGQPVVGVGGSGRGADTALVLTPSYSASLFDIDIHEILCKPSL